MDRVSLRSIRATLALMVMRSIYQGKCRSVTWVERRETFGAALAWPGAHNGKAFSRRARARVFVHERHDLPPGNKGGAPKATRSPDERQRNPGRAFKLPTRSRISRSLSSGRPLRAGPVGSSGLQIHPATRLQRREAERRQTRISNLRTPTFILAASGRTEEGARRASTQTSVRKSAHTKSTRCAACRRSTAALAAASQRRSSAPDALPGTRSFLSQSSELLADRS
jgi:hypothetical protein